jgi:hypothetical protein
MRKWVLYYSLYTNVPFLLGSQDYVIKENLLERFGSKITGVSIVVNGVVANLPYPMYTIDSCLNEEFIFRYIEDYNQLMGCYDRLPAEKPLQGA